MYIIYTCKPVAMVMLSGVCTAVNKQYTDMTSYLSDVLIYVSD